MGMAPLIMPATLESIHCWAIGKSVSGMAIQTVPSRAMRPQSSRSTGWRACRKSASVAVPRPMRARVTTPGANERRPISMNRKDEPQMTAMTARMPQSSSV